MADSGITKRALAQALKELLKQQPLSKIRISDICDKCEMNRKSFYYHFKDKYDLVNWIFISECPNVFNNSVSGDVWGALGFMCEYFYENRSYYRRVFKSVGQNCFSESLRAICKESISNRLHSFSSDGEKEFAKEYYADIVVSGIERWITSPEPITPEEYIRRTKMCVQLLSGAK